MKMLKNIAMVAIVAAVLSSCAAAVSPVTGGLITNVKAPVAVTSNSGSSKVGTAQAKSVLGLFASGDASIDAAAKSAGITKIHHVDYESKSVLGLVASFKVYVYGE